MRLKFLFLLFFIIAAIYNACSQQSSIVFTSDEDARFIIYKPMDRIYNNHYPTDTVVLHPGSEYTYRFTVDDWCIVKCASQTKLWPNIFIEKDSTVRMHNTTTGIKFEGSNAVANELLYNSTIFREMHLKSIIDSLLQTKNIQKIETIISNTRLLPQTEFLYNELDSLYANNKISKKCYNYCIKTVDYQIKTKMLYLFQPDIDYAKILNDTIKNYTSLITKTFFDDEEIAYFPTGNGMTSMSCNFLFRQLDDTAKNHLTEGFAKETVGPYSKFLLQKGLTRLSLFFDGFVLQYKYGVNEFDRIEMYKYLKDKYPQSEAVQIMGKLVADELKDTTVVEPVFLACDSVANFADLGNLESLQNKYLFVDLWASWCLPCRSEFSHNKKLNPLLGNYGNIEKIYISIDEKEKNWKEAIKALKLSGYHLRASEKLLTFLRTEIYKANAISIPRYLLLDTHGNILNDDLVHPSDIENLKKQLDKYLKN